MTSTEKSSEYVEYGLSHLVRKSLEKYFDSHKNDTVPSGLYDRVIDEVERVMFEVTLEHVSGNRLKASKILGINRNTLRKKMAKTNGGENNAI